MEINKEDLADSSLPNGGDELVKLFAITRILGGKMKDEVLEFAEDRDSLKSVIHGMQDAILLLNEENMVLLCNEAFKKIFRVQKDSKCIGKPIEELIRLPKVINAIEKLRSTHSTVEKEIEYDSGKGIYLHLRASFLLKEKSHERILLFFRNITGEKKVEQMRVDFIANVSHELKTPLTPILGYVETIADGAVDEENAKKFLKIIHKNAERMKRLIEDLLALSNIELGKIKMTYDEMEPVGIIKSVEQVLIPIAQKKDIEITYKVESDVGYVYTDRDRIIQILLNIMDNAVKYTQKGGKVNMSCRLITVTNETAKEFSYAPLGDYQILPEYSGNWKKSFVEFTVKDTGGGIAEKYISRLTERFFRVDASRSRELGGTGLGLSIVKHLLIAHGGSLKIESVLEQGTSVSFVIPKK